MTKTHNGKCERGAGCLGVTRTTHCICAVSRFYTFRGSCRRRLAHGLEPPGGMVLPLGCTLLSVPSSRMMVDQPGSGSPVVRQKLKGQSEMGVCPEQLLVHAASFGMPGPSPPW